MKMSDSRFGLVVDNDHMNSGLGMDVCAVIKACNFAAERHSSQRRKDAEQTPYINHPIG